MPKAEWWSHEKNGASYKKKKEFSLKPFPSVANAISNLSKITLQVSIVSENTTLVYEAFDKPKNLLFSSQVSNILDLKIIIIDRCNLQNYYCAKYCIK